MPLDGGGELKAAGAHVVEDAWLNVKLMPLAKLGVVEAVATDVAQRPLYQRTL